MATTDVLTNIANRASVLNRFNEGFARQRRNISQLGCLMIDVDHFKSINDHYGHPKGDDVLRELAAIISSTLRQYDTFGRYGGEEFLMVLDGVNKEHLAALAERTRAAVWKPRSTSKSGSPTRSPSNSWRHACHLGDQSIDDVIKRADEALYLAKNSRPQPRGTFDR